MSLPSINFLHLTVSEIQPGQTFSNLPTQTPTHPDSPKGLWGKNQNNLFVAGNAQSLVWVREKFRELKIQSKTQHLRMPILFQILIYTIQNVGDEHKSKQNTISKKRKLNEKETENQKISRYL